MLIFCRIYNDKHGNNIDNINNNNNNNDDDNNNNNNNNNLTLQILNLPIFWNRLSLL